MPTTASQATRRSRACMRATRSSSTTDRIPEVTVTATKKPTTAHAQASYEGGKLVPETATMDTTTSAARNRTSQRPGRLNTAFLHPGERPRGELTGRLFRVVEIGDHGVPFAVSTHVACRDERVEPKP